MGASGRKSGGFGHRYRVLASDKGRLSKLSTRACEIRLRAERKAGELLKKMEKAKGAREPGTNRGATRCPGGTASKTLDDLGISKKQSSRWQQLAEVPEDQFEAALVGSEKRSTATTGPKTISDQRSQRATSDYGISKDQSSRWQQLAEIERAKAGRPRENPSRDTRDFPEAKDARRPWLTRGRQRPIRPLSRRIAPIAAAGRAFGLWVAP